MDLKTDIMAKMTEEECQKIYDYCINNMVLVYADPTSSWDIFMDARNFCYSIAKPFSTCGNSCFGGLDYIKKLIDKNHFKKEFLMIEL